MEKEKLERNEALQLLAKYGANYYKFLPKELRKDKKILLTALKSKWEPLIFADRSLKNDKEVILSAVKHSAKPLIYVKNSLKKDSEFANKLLNVNVDCIKYILTQDISYKNALKVAESSQPYLKYLKEEYRRDRKIASAAVASNWQNIFYALYFDKDMIKDALAHSWHFLSIVPEYLKRETEIIKLALAKNKWAIKHFTHLTHNKEIIATLLKSSGFDYRVLELLSPESRKDLYIVKQVIDQKGGQAIAYADESLYTDRTLVLYALTRFRDYYYFDNAEANKLALKIFKNIILPYYINDSEIVIIFLRNNSTIRELVYNYLSAVLKTNKDICMLVPYSVIAENMKPDIDIAINAVKTDLANFALLPDNLQRDKRLIDVLLENLPRNFKVFDTLPDFIKNDEKIKQHVLEICTQKIKETYLSRSSGGKIMISQIHLSNLPMFLREDEKFCLTAIQIDPTNFTAISPKLADSEDFMRKAIKIYPNSFYMCSERLSQNTEIRELAKSLGCKIYDK